VFLGAGDPDPHVPWIRVEETATVLERQRTAVTLRRYPGMGHAVSREELEVVRTLAAELVAADRTRR
jgi:predicted esterase